MHLQTNQVSCIYSIRLYVSEKSLIKSPNLSSSIMLQGRMSIWFWGIGAEKNKLTSEAILPVYIKTSC